MWPSDARGGSDQRRIDIHRVTKDWNSKTVTWDNKPSYDPKVADYIAFSGPSLTRLVFDITGVVKDWYADGKNYGLMMKEHGEEEGTYNEYISSDDNLDDNAGHTSPDHDPVRKLRGPGGFLDVSPA